MAPSLQPQPTHFFSSPTAQIVLRGHRSDPLPISLGTHHGCPLSPLLFVIAIETLATAIHQNTNILGIDSGVGVTSPPHHPTKSTVYLVYFFPDKSEALNINLSHLTYGSIQSQYFFLWQQTSLSYFTQPPTFPHFIK